MFMQEADPVGIKEAVLQDFLHAKLKIFGWAIFQLAGYMATCVTLIKINFGSLV